MYFILRPSYRCRTHSLIFVSFCLFVIYVYFRLGSNGPHGTSHVIKIFFSIFCIFLSLLRYHEKSTLKVPWGHIDPNKKSTLTVPWGHIDPIKKRYVNSTMGP